MTEKPKTTCMPPDFAIEDGWLYFISRGKKKRVCTEVEVVAYECRQESPHWYWILRFKDPDGKERQVPICFAAIRGHLSKAWTKPLIKEGLRMAEGKTSEFSLLRRYVCQSKPTRIINSQ